MEIATKNNKPESQGEKKKDDEENAAKGKEGAKQAWTSQKEEWIWQEKEDDAGLCDLSWHEDKKGPGTQM